MKRTRKRAWKKRTGRRIWKKRIRHKASGWSVYFFTMRYPEAGFTLCRIEFIIYLNTHSISSSCKKSMFLLSSVNMGGYRQSMQVILSFVTMSHKLISTLLILFNRENVKHYYHTKLRVCAVVCAVVWNDNNILAINEISLMSRLCSTERMKNITINGTMAWSHYANEKAFELSSSIYCCHMTV